MIVTAHSIPDRVGLYQLIDFGLFAVPLHGKTRPALFHASSYKDALIIFNLFI